MTDLQILNRLLALHRVHVTVMGPGIHASGPLLQSGSGWRVGGFDFETSSVDDVDLDTNIIHLR